MATLTKPAPEHSLQWITKRLPKKHDALLVFSLCLTLTNFWALLRFLHQFPRFIVVLPLSDTAGIFGYFGLFALLDAILFFLAVSIVAIVLPRKLLRQRYAVAGSIFVLLLTAWGGVHLRWMVKIYGTQFFNLSLLYIIGSLAFVAFAVKKQQRWHVWVIQALERLRVLAYFYLAIDFICVAIVLVRNVPGWL